MTDEGRQPWFAAKRVGYGAGLPIAWQGWAVLIGYLVAVTLLAATAPERLPPIRLGAILALTGGFVAIAARRTRGGWRWRSGGEPD